MNTLILINVICLVGLSVRLEMVKVVSHDRYHAVNRTMLYITAGFLWSILTGMMASLFSAHSTAYGVVATVAGLMTAVPLLEATDSILTDTHNKREW